MKMKLAVVGAFCALLFVGAEKARANGYGGCGWGYGLGMGYLYNTLDFRVPYFAAHPPVYYSYPVPRAYGYSPFAYPPHVRTPEILGHTLPSMITNPHYQTSSESAPRAEPQTTTDQVTAVQRRIEPQVIENPHFRPTTQLARADQ